MSARAFSDDPIENLKFDCGCIGDTEDYRNISALTVGAK